MARVLLFVLLLLITLQAVAGGLVYNERQDTSEVIQLNKRGLDVRLTSPEQTIEYANKALIIAQKINYTKGIGESYRIIGIGYNYLNKPLLSINNYLTALNYFLKINDLRGIAKVYNNISTLYRDVDYDKSLDFLKKALVIATKLADDKLIASTNLNIGTVYYRKNSFYQALSYYNKANKVFIAEKDTVNLIQCLRNKGVIYYNLHLYDKAESLLLEANSADKEKDLNESVASIDVTLMELYINKGKYNDAENTMQEGLAFAKIIKDEKLESDIKYNSYLLELKRKNYQKALEIQTAIHAKDSTYIKQNISNQITKIQEQEVEQARQRLNESLLQRQQYDRIKFGGVAVMAGLLLILVGLLINNVRRKVKTNNQLTELNAEVSRQKDNLDRINHHLEEIIDERTKDLQVKNKKLSEYSSYLSHQIRGPIATLKGLMNLEKEGLVDQADCIKMMNKCVSEIDDKIIEMSDMLHDPNKTGF